MITAKEALELTQQPEPEISDEEFQQYLNRVEFHIKDLASHGSTHMRFWCNREKDTVEEARKEQRKAEIVAKMLEKELKGKGYDVGIPDVLPWVIVVDWSGDRRPDSPDKPTDLASCQKMLDECVQRGRQMKYYLTTASNGFGDLFRKPEDRQGMIFSQIPDARKAYADMIRVRLGQEGVELFLNLEKDIAESINAGCSDKYYMKNDCRTHRMYNLICDHYMVVKAWMDVMGYRLEGYQDDDPRYMISWDINEDK